jgi:hypothetical protein
MAKVSEFQRLDWATVIDRSTKNIQTELDDAVQNGHITSDEKTYALESYSYHCDEWRKLILLGGNKEYLTWGAILVLNITEISLTVGSGNPSKFVFDQLHKELLRKRAAHSRAAKASASLSGAEVESIILTCFQDRSVVKNAVSDGHKAGRALDEVNRRLAERAAELGRKATRYKNADSLRRRYAMIKERTSN